MTRQRDSAPGPNPPLAALRPVHGANDAQLRSLTAALLEDEQVDNIECESAEAAPAVMLIGGQGVAMIFADIRLRGVRDGIDRAHEVKLRWPLLPVVFSSGHPIERIRELPPGVAYIPKPWQPLKILMTADQARTRSSVGGSF